MKGRKCVVRGIAVLLSCVLVFEMFFGHLGMAVQAYAQPAEQSTEVIESSDEIQIVSQNASEESMEEEAIEEVSGEELSKDALSEIEEEQEVEEVIVKETGAEVAEDLVVKSESSLTLEHDMTVNSLKIESGYVDLSEYELTVLGDVVINYGILKVSSGELICNNFSLNRDGHLEMKDVNGCITVKGAASFISEEENTLSAGIIRIAGNATFDEKYSGYTEFSGTHRVILNGTNPQTITFGNGINLLNILELQNTSEDGVTSNGAVMAREFILNGCKFSNSKATGRTGWILQDDFRTEGDLVLVGGTLDLNGKTLIVPGNFYQINGKVNVNKGTLIVEKDYALEAKEIVEGEAKYSRSAATLCMTNEEDQVFVGRDFRVGTNIAHENFLTNGTLYVKGNVTNTRYQEDYSFKSSGKFKLVLNGESDQVVQINSRVEGQNSIENLEITNVSGKVIFEEKKEPTVSGEFRDNGNAFAGYVKLRKGATLHNNATAGNIWIWENGTTISEEWTVEGSFKQTQNISYTQNITIGGDFTINGGNANLNGKTMVVNGNTYLGLDSGSSRVTPGGGRFECFGDVVCKKLNSSSYETGFMMTNTNDYVLIHGDFSTETRTATDCTAGIMEIKGDFYQGGSSSASFVASGSHKVVLSGSKEQKVTFTQEKSKFATVELNNPEGIYAPNGIQADKIIWNGIKVRTDQEGECGYRLTESKPILGDFLMVAGEMDLAGYDLTIEGDLIQSGGTMLINGGTLHVKGNYYLENVKKANGEVTESAAGSGDLVMINENDKVVVDGNFCMGTVSASSDKLTNGTLEVKGNFTRKNYGNALNFVTSDSFRVVLSGNAEQKVEFPKVSNDKNCIANLEITNASGKVSFTEDAEPIVSGEYKDNGNATMGYVKLGNGATLYNNTTVGSILLDDNTYNVQAPWAIGGDLKQLQTVKYTAPITVDGDFFVLGSAFLNGNKMRIEGDVYLGMGMEKNSLIVPEKGRFECGGNMVCEVASSGYYLVGLEMKNEADYVLVEKNFLSKSGAHGEYSAGTLEIKGDFIETNSKRAFSATKTHRVLMSGNEKQTVSFAMDSARCSVLELNNPSENGVHFTMNYIPAAQFIPNDTNVSLPGNAKVGWTLKENEVFEGDLKLACGELNLNGYTLRVEGDVCIASGTLYVNGGKLEVTGDLRYQTVTSTEEDQAPVYGTSTAVLKMLNAEDHVLVHGDFVMQSSEDMSGLITAGTLELKGDYLCLTSKAAVCRATENHRILFSGDARQQISLKYSNINDCFANMEVTNTSESGVYVASKVRVAGTLRDAGHKLSAGNDCGLYLKNVNAITTECCGGTICLEDASVMERNLTVFGTLKTGTKAFDLNGKQLAVSDFIADAQVSIKGGTLSVDKDVTIGETGILVMTNEADSVVVGNQFLMNSKYDHTNMLTAGILEVKGHFVQAGKNANNFAASGTHMTVLSGKSGRTNKDFIQSITFNNPGSSKFRILKLTKKMARYIFVPSDVTLYDELIYEVEDEAPAQVENIRVGNTTTSTVELIWDTPYDDDGVVGYEIYKDQTKIAVTSSNRYTIDGLKPGETCVYIIYAYDKSQNYSPASAPFEVTTKEDTTAPEVPTGLKIKTRTGSAITLMWNVASDDVEVVGYNVYRDGVLLAEVPDVTVYKDTSVVEDGYYSYEVTAVDAAGNESERSQEINASPMMPEILRATPEENARIGGEKQTLKVYYKNVGNSVGNRVKFEYRNSESDEWSMIGEDFCEQKVYNATEFYSEITWSLVGLEEAEYKVRVSVYDADNNVDSKEYTYYLDAEGPMAPTNLSVTSTDGIVVVTWAESGSKDCVKYNVYRSVGNENGYELIATSKENSYTDKNVEKDKTYYYKISGIDDFGHEGETGKSESVLVEIDTEAPVIKSIKASEEQRINGVAMITVEASDNVEVDKIALSYYDVKTETWVNVEQEKEAVNGTATFELDTTQLANAVYTFRALATDVNGNKSLQDESGEYKAQIEIDNQGIEKIVIVEAKGYETHVTLKWNDVADDDISYFVVEKKDLEGQFIPVKTVRTTLGAHIENLPANETFVFRVVGYDTLGNRGEASDEVTVATSMDVTAPIIKNFYPVQKEFNQVIPISIGVTDNVGVKSLKLTYSTNKEEWTELVELLAEGTPKEYTFTYDFDVTNLPEGTVYVRAYAYDEKENESNYEGQPIENFFLVDRTPPSKVDGLKADGKDGYVTLSWSEMDSEEHIQSFSIYRAEEESQMFTLLADKVKCYYYDDVTAIKGVTYRYKVCAQDAAGNVGAFSDVVMGLCSMDREAPIVHAVSPDAGSTIAGEVLIRTIVTDNVAVDEIVFEYKEVDLEDEIWTQIGVVKESEAGQYPSVVWDVTKLQSAAYKLRITATDQEKNSSKPYEVEYIVDSDAPQAPVLEAKSGGYSASLTWNKNEEEDFKQYEILRKRVGEESYKAIKTLTETSYKDTNLLGGKTYMYVVRAYDNAGNYAESNVVSVVPTTMDTTAPVILTSDTYSVCVGDEVWMDASQSYDNVGITQYKWDMGNGDVKYGARAKYVYGQIGEYMVTLTASDAAGNQSQKTIVVKVRSKEKAKITFSIRSQSASNTLLSYAYIAVENSAGTVENYTADMDAELTLTLDAGAYKISAYKEGYLPKVLEITVSDGDLETMILSLEKGEIVTGELTQRRMTFEELKELGVDLQNPNNWYEYTYSVTYTDRGVSGTATYKFPPTGTTEPVKIIWIDGKDAFAKVLDLGDSKIVVIYKVEKQLKEMYDVTLLVTNNAAAGYGFDIIDSTAELLLPEGMSLIDLPQPQSLVNDLGVLAAQETKETHWYIKADRTGSYMLSAEFDGMLLPFEVPVETVIYADEPLEVEYIESNIECEVTFDFDMEGVEDLKRYTSRGGCIAFPDEPVKPGYRFVGWYYGDRMFLEDEKVMQDILLVARYERKTSEDGKEDQKPGSGSEEQKPGSGSESQKPESEEKDSDDSKETVKKPETAKKLPKKNAKKQVNGITYRVTKSHKTRGTVEVYKVKEDKKTVTIPDKITIDGYTFKVTAIYKKAFKNNKKLEKITIKDNIKSIGTQAFYGCKKLKNVTVGKGLESIGAKAFYNCKSLKKITISSKKLESVGHYALKGIHKNAKIYVPSTKLNGYKKLFKGKGQKSSVQIKKK